MTRYAARHCALLALRGDVVGLQLTKQTSAYVLMLACLARGAIYMLLDPVSPKGRLERALDRIRPRLVVTDADCEQDGKC